MRRSVTLLLHRSALRQLAAVQEVELRPLLDCMAGDSHCSVIHGALSPSYSDVWSILSPSHDIFVNLALEEAFARAAVFPPSLQSTAGQTAAPSMCLFSYIDASPGAIVVGRNQSIYREANVPYCRREGIQLARRPSGGGTVFHDDGNVNFCFLSHRHVYDPDRTTAILMHFLHHTFGIATSRLTTSSRSDIFVDGRKISGSAMRLHKDIAYHHCTLLVSSDRRLRESLQPSGTWTSFTTNATTSVRSPTTSLLELVGQKALIGEWQDDTGILSPLWARPRLRTATVVQWAFARYFSVHARELFRRSWRHAVVDVDAMPVDNPQKIVEGDIWQPATLSSTDATVLCIRDTSASVSQAAFVYAAGRRKQPGDVATIGEETQRLQSADWVIGSSPSMETTVECIMGDNACQLLARSAGVDFDALKDDNVTIVVKTSTTAASRVGAVEWSLRLRRGGDEERFELVWLNACLSPLLKDETTWSLSAAAMQTYVDENPAMLPRSLHDILHSARIGGSCASTLWESVQYGLSLLSDADLHQQRLQDSVACYGTNQDSPTHWGKTIATVMCECVVGWSDRNGW